MASTTTEEKALTPIQESRTDDLTAFVAGLEALAGGLLEHAAKGRAELLARAERQWRQDGVKPTYRADAGTISFKAGEEQPYVSNPGLFGDWLRVHEPTGVDCHIAVMPEDADAALTVLAANGIEDVRLVSTPRETYVKAFLKKNAKAVIEWPRCEPSCRAARRALGRCPVHQPDRYVRVELHDDEAGRTNVLIDVPGLGVKAGSAPGVSLSINAGVKAQVAEAVDAFLTSRGPGTVEDGPLALLAGGNPERMHADEAPTIPNCRCGAPQTSHSGAKHRGRSRVPGSTCQRFSVED